MSTKQPDVLLGKHHAIGAFASKDDEKRRVIQSVHYNHEKQQLEATDGAVLIRVPVTKSDEFVPVSVNGEPKDCVIPLPALAKAIGNIPKSNLPVLEHARLSVTEKDGQQLVNLTTSDLDQELNVACKPIEDKYPDCEAVEPTEAPTLSICLAANILKRIAEYAEKHATGTIASVRLDFINELKPVRFSINVKDALGVPRKVTGVAMPRRME